jgi:hypothetical protein
MLSGRLRKEVRVERQQSVNAIRGHAQVLGDEFRGSLRDIAVQVLGFLTCLYD